MTQTSRLVLEIDSRDAEQKAADTRKALEALESAGLRVKPAMDKAGAGIDGAGNSAQKAAKSISGESDEIERLLGRIDPLSKKLAELDRQEQELAKHRKAGKLDLETYTEYQKKITTTRNELTRFNDSLTRTGNTAKQTAAALRGVPAQFTDIAVSLQGGQAPLTVFLQQGGQLKDMFGGVGPAAKALGGYIVGLINPFTVLAATLGTLAAVYYDAEKEASAFNKALFSGSASSGQTAGTLSAIAKSASDITGRLGEAKSAVIALAASSGLSQVQFRNLAEAATAIGEFTGKSAGEVAKSLGDMGNNATKAAEKISAQYGLLTSAQYEVIKGLDDQGKKQEALDLLSETLNQNAQARFKRYRDSLSDIERDWNDVGTAISNAYSQVRGELFPDSAKQIEIIERILKTRKDGGLAGAVSTGLSKLNGALGLDDGNNDDSTAALEKRLALLKQNAEVAKSTAELDGKTTRENQARIEADVKWSALAKKELSDQAKLVKDITDARRLGVEAGKSQADIDKVVADIQAKYDKAQPKTPKAKAYTEDAGMKALDAARQTQAVLLQQNASLNAQGIATEKVGAQAQALIKWEQQLADIKGKKTLTADQKSLLASQDLITAQLKKNVALEREAEISKGIQQAQKDQVQLLTLTGQLREANSLKSSLDDAAQMAEYERQGNVEAAKRLETMIKIRDINLNAAQKPGTIEGVTQAPNATGLDPAVGGAGSEIDRLDAAAEKLEAWRATELERQAAYLDLKAINEETYAARVANIDQQATQNRQKIEEAKNQALLVGASDFFGNMASLSQSGNKKLAAIGKAAAIIQATMDGYLAVQKALAAFPPPFNFAAAAAVGVATAANVANIAGIGFSGGGYTGAGGVNEYAGPAHKGEVVWSQADIRKAGGVATVEALRKGNVAPIRPGAKGTGPDASRSQVGAAPVVNVIEDASKAGQSQSREVDGRWVIDQFVANINDNGKGAKAIQQMLGMGRAAR
ncbi:MULTISPECIES: phage tail length tape measure family protein [Pseudomonas]|uniref:Prothage tail length tape measure n=1 Tax=Pseudomonas lactis TaxID=1615674 RepID=A0ABS9FY14_9PSED|nr:MULTISPECIES: phage tail length tape measure family protein [Pseudomonas]MBI6975141.1 phage tail length tape measure family protein [Pseudomonas lactis]MCF5004293.1 prothage tail length tape measure [Pseudomonas lactis]MCF5008647.1 prothage tail length tape measure [Pseudomonas lactis]MCF5015266.1 prothage tail length tape measure [Pseudomonas lactis]MCF5021043.1 prothage tail length tape measure [Pseudomonas lactis]